MSTKKNSEEKMSPGRRQYLDIKNNYQDCLLLFRMGDFYETFDEDAKKEFLKGAQVAYETIITDFSDNDNKLIASKPLLSKEIYEEFNKALKDRSNRGHYAEITFIGIKSADIKEHKKIDKALQVTVDFVSEIITCIRDKEKKIVSGSPDKIKTIYDTWTFSRDMRSTNPNWLLVNTVN